MAITNFISTVWSENLLKQLGEKYVGVLNCNREFDGDIKSKGSKVKICGLNKNILRKHYYIVLSSSPEEASNPSFGPEEVRDIAFNELYTKCQSAIGSLAVCGVPGKILNSIATIYPFLLGGSADVSKSTTARIKNTLNFSANTPG